MELRTIPGQPDYAAGDDGSIWSLKRGQHRRMRCFVRGRRGHLGVNLTHGGRYRMHSVHRLIALAWLGEPPSTQHLVMHLDDDPTHNARENLAYGLPAENSSQMTARGRQAVGERVGRARLVAEQVRLIRARCESGERQTAVAADVGITATMVNDIMRRRTWRHL